MSISDIAIEPSTHIVECKFQTKNSVYVFSENVTRRRELEYIVDDLECTSLENILVITSSLIMSDWKDVSSMSSKKYDIMDVSKIHGFEENTRNITNSQIKPFILKKCNNVSTIHCVNTVNRMSLDNTLWSAKYDRVIVDSGVVPIITEEELYILITICKRTSNGVITMVNTSHFFTYSIYMNVVLPLTLNILPHSTKNVLSMYIFPRQLEVLMRSRSKYIDFKPNRTRVTQTCINSHDHYAHKTTLYSLNRILYPYCVYNYDIESNEKKSGFFYEQCKRIQTNKTCKICLDKCADSILSCGHIGCVSCCLHIMDQTRKCPYCRKKIMNIYCVNDMEQNYKMNCLHSIINETSKGTVVVCDTASLQRELFHKLDETFDCYFLNIKHDYSKATKIKNNDNAVYIVDTLTVMSMVFSNRMNIVFYHPFNYIKDVSTYISNKTNSDVTILYYDHPLESTICES